MCVHRHLWALMPVPQPPAFHCASVPCIVPRCPSSCPPLPLLPGFVSLAWCRTASLQSCLPPRALAQPLLPGDAFLAGHSVRHLDLREAYRILGYCPQAGALIDLMTGREHLEMYARIQGVNVAETVADIVQALCLEEHIDLLVRECSGGTRRKLALAVAMIGRCEGGCIGCSQADAT